MKTKKRKVRRKPPAFPSIEYILRDPAIFSGRRKWEASAFSMRELAYLIASRSTYVRSGKETAAHLELTVYRFDPENYVQMQRYQIALKGRNDP